MNSFGVFLFSVCAVLQIGANAALGEIPDSVDCMRAILEQSFVNYAAVYFADNPRGTDPPIIPSSLDPPTANNLFKAYYGEDATPSGFKSAVTRILYSDLRKNDANTSPTTQDAILEADRVFLRSTIYTYAKAGSYDIAREKFGVLLFNGYKEILNAGTGDCFDRSVQKQMKDVIHAELARIRNEMGEFQFGQFLGLGSGTTLAFAIDDTGSMGGEIEAAKQRAINIIDERQGSLDQPQNFVLVPFNDPGVGPLTVTHDPELFKDAIGRLYANGGGDAPELSMRGIQLAVENSNAGSTIFVITDIDAKDVELQDNVVAQAKQKNIKVTFLLTNRIETYQCRHGHGLDVRCKNPSLKFGYELYEYIARSTGGRILVVSKGDIFKATEVIESTLKQGLETLYIKRFKAGKFVDHFYVDSSLKEIFLQTEGDCRNVIVRRANEAKAVPEEGDLKVDKLKAWRIAVNGSFGRYSLNIKPTGQCDVTISAKSTKGFVKTLAKKVTDPVTGESWLQRFEGQPLNRENVVVLIDEFGKLTGDKTESVSLVQKTSDVKHNFTIADEDSTHHIISLKKYRKKSSLLMITGVDKMGYKFHRVSPAPIEYVSLKIDCSGITDMVFRAGDKATVNVTIKNLGREDLFSIEVNDDKGYTVPQKAKRLKLARNSSGKLSISFSSNKGEQTGTVSTVTITAKAQRVGNLVFKQCRLIIGQKEKPDIESFHVVSNINSRFVETAVTSTVFNNASISRMAEFNVIMPLDSFITEFSMTIDNVTYPGDIKEKEKAERIFEAARARGVTAGHVAAREKSTTVFKTSTNLEANKRVVFDLKYQQLLRRSRGQYRHEVVIQTEQPVGKMSVDVYICETRPLDRVQVLGFDTDQSVVPGLISIPGVTVHQRRTTAHIAFKPTREEQLRLSPMGLNGKFVVEYDVVRERGKEVNEIVADKNHFVHFYSPEMDFISKRVVFVLDNSGSMHGRKMEQVRNAMIVILDELSAEDHFAIIMFNSNISKWDSGTESNMARANAENIASAKQFLQDVKAKGSTNLQLAITSGIEVLRNFSAESEKSLHPTSDFILLLTDGRPTEGIVEARKLVNSIDRTNNQTYGIHTIGFGTLVDMSTLAKIAARNKGSSIQIFEDIDADSQITDFFKTFARPMLHDIEITYSPEEVESTTIPTFPVICYGAEVIVAGRFTQDVVSNESRRRKRETLGAMMLLNFVIKGKLEDDKDYKLDVEIEPVSPSNECLEDSTQMKNFTERLNVFMELQHMLKQISAENNETVKDELEQAALNQSLEYGFVTPGITAMVVLKPEDLKEIEKKLEEEKIANETMTDNRTMEVDDSGSGSEEELDTRDFWTDSTSTTPPPTTTTRLPLLGEDVFADLTGLDAMAPRPRRPVAGTVRPMSPPRRPSPGSATGRSSAHGSSFLSALSSKHVPLSADRVLGGPRRVESAYDGLSRAVRPPPRRPLGFFGDPHFLVSIGAQFTICFNWNGQNGQIFNILHDDVNGITVNGRLKVLLTHDVKQEKVVYVDKIGIKLWHQNVTIEISCYDITVTDAAGNVTKLFYDVTGTVDVAGIRVLLYGKSKMQIAEALFEITPHISFRVIRRVSAHGDKIVDHLDFTVVDTDGISKNAFGVLGQFSHDDARKKELQLDVDSENEKNAIVWYKKKPVHANRRRIYDQNRARFVDCWFVLAPKELLDEGETRYVLNGLFDEPDMKKRTRAKKQIFA